MVIDIPIEDLMKYLENLYSAREYLIKQSRDILTLCRRAIVLCIHDNPEAARYVSELMMLFEKYKEFAKMYPQLFFSNFYRSIESEYVEAIEFCSIIRGNKFPSYKDLDVSPTSFVLGLLDMLGELKRYSLELIKRERYDESLHVFEVAENIFNQLEELAFAENVITGLKRKLDIYRKVLDDWKELLIDIVSREKLKKIIEQVKSHQR